MKRLEFLLSIVILNFCIALSAQGREISGVTVNWAPHYGSEVEDGGALSVITKEAFRRAGHEANIDFIAWNRALKNVEAGQDDFVMGAYYNSERAAIYWMSDPIYSIDMGLVALKDLGFNSMDSLQDLTDFKIGVSLGYANTPEFDAADYLNKEPAPSPKLNMRKLFRGRVDLVAGAFDILRYEATAENLPTAQLAFVDPPLQSNALHIMISRAVPDGEELLVGFNNALAEMKQDGTMRNILSEYLNR